MKDNNLKKAAKITGNVAAHTAGGSFKLAIKIIVTALLIILTTGMLFTCIFAVYVKTSLSSEMGVELDNLNVQLTSSIYYKTPDGDYVKHTDLYSKKNTVWVKYGQIPQYMVQAAIAIEDKRFEEHKGVDWYRTTAAVGNMFLSMRDNFGGSTLTQQLIKNVTTDDDVTVQRKLLEIFRALEFEKKYTKEEIMEWYLNSIYLGQACYGIGTASQTYFGKDARDLSLAECAALVGITNNPSKYDPFISIENNKKRQETILFEMYDQGRITQTEYQNALDEPLSFTRQQNEEHQIEIRNWYDDMIINDVIRDLQVEKGVSEQVATKLLYSGGLKIYAAIDTGIQAIVDDMYTNPENMPQSWGYNSQSLQSATVIIDPYNGDIVAMSGGVGQKTVNLGYCRATIAQRPPGSSFKPVAAYAPAMNLGYITQSTAINDSPGIKLPGTTWFPKNSGGGYSGQVTIRTALQRSLNTVAAQLIGVLTPEVSYDFLTNTLEFDLAEEDRDYAPLALGQLTNGVTVREMAQAYTPFVNSGTFTRARSYTHIMATNTSDEEPTMFLENLPKTKSALKEDVAYNMADMMENAVAAGTGVDARLRNMAVGGKTGTTSDDKDRYFVGFTPYYVCAVWTGYDNPEPMRFSGNPAARIFKSLMDSVHEDLEYKSFPDAPKQDNVKFGGNNSSSNNQSYTDSPSSSNNPGGNTGAEVPTVPTSPQDGAPDVSPSASPAAPGGNVGNGGSTPVVPAPVVTQKPVVTDPPPVVTVPPATVPPAPPANTPPPVVNTPQPQPAETAPPVVVTPPQAVSTPQAPPPVAPPPAVDIPAVPDAPSAIEG